MSASPGEVERSADGLQPTLRELTPTTLALLTPVEQRWAEAAFAARLRRPVRRRYRSFDEDGTRVWWAYQDAAMNVVRGAGIVGVAGLAVFGKFQDDLPVAAIGCVILAVGAIGFLLGYARLGQARRSLRRYGASGQPPAAVPDVPRPAPVQRLASFEAAGWLTAAVLLSVITSVRGASHGAGWVSVLCAATLGLGAVAFLRLRQRARAVADQNTFDQWWRTRGRWLLAATDIPLLVGVLIVANRH